MSNPLSANAPHATAEAHTASTSDSDGVNVFRTSMLALLRHATSRISRSVSSPRSTRSAGTAPVTRGGDLSTALASTTPGQQLALTVHRGNGSEIVLITLGS